MLLALYKPNQSQMFIAKILRALGFKLYEWEANAVFLGGEIITFPNSSQYVDIMEESRADLKSYFSEYFDSVHHEPADIYFRKKYDIQYLDYYSFRKVLNITLQGNNEKCIALGGGYNKKIFERKVGSFLDYLLFPLFLVYGYWTLMFYALKAFVSTVLYKGDVSPGDVLYLRKKAYPDLGMKDKLCGYLQQKNISCTGAIALYASKPEKYGFNFLNGLKGASGIVLENFFSELSEIASVISVQKKNALFLNDIKGYIKNIFLARSEVATGSKVIVGVLVDKPIFVLLSHYKDRQQRIMAINESFFYPPFRSFDYNMLDVYFSLNNLDAGLQNKYGGNIGQIVPVEFVRKSLESTSEGLSDELRELVERHERVAVATAMQISEVGFTQWGRDEVNRFVSGVIELALGNPSDLFILKGKKNELSHLTDDVVNSLNEVDNIFTIHSTKPRFLKHDQFEDLLAIADIVISMSHTSTTIWQAVAEDIPVIAINDAHSPSFLSEYDYVEVTSEKMISSYVAWFSLDDEDRRAKVRSLSRRVNLGESRGLVQIADFIVDSLGEYSGSGAGKKD